MQAKVIYKWLSCDVIFNFNENPSFYTDWKIDINSSLNTCTACLSITSVKDDPFGYCLRGSECGSNVPVFLSCMQPESQTQIPS